MNPLPELTILSGQAFTVQVQGVLTFLEGGHLGLQPIPFLAQTDQLLILSGDPLLEAFPFLCGRLHALGDQAGQKHGLGADAPECSDLLAPQLVFLLLTFPALLRLIGLIHEQFRLPGQGAGLPVGLLPGQPGLHLPGPGLVQGTFQFPRPAVHVIQVDLVVPIGLRLGQA